MNIKEIKEMINLMNDNFLTELEVERDGTKIRIKKQPKGALTNNQSALQAEYEVQETPVVQEPAQKEVKTTSNTAEIKSPMVGTFYRAPSPEAAPFIEAGQSVDLGQVICIVEAMKLMNEIKSDVKGKIKEVLVENGDPVEFGQPLFIVEVS